MTESNVPAPDGGIDLDDLIAKIRSAYESGSASDASHASHPTLVQSGKFLTQDIVDLLALIIEFGGMCPCRIEEHVRAMPLEEAKRLFGASARVPKVLATLCGVAVRCRRSEEESTALMGHIVAVAEQAAAEADRLLSDDE